MASQEAPPVSNSSIAFSIVLLRITYCPYKTHCKQKELIKKLTQNTIAGNISDDSVILSNNQEPQI